MWMSPGSAAAGRLDDHRCLRRAPAPELPVLDLAGDGFLARRQRTHGRGAPLLLGLDDEDLGGLGVDGADHLARSDGGGGVEQRELRLPLGGGEDVLDRLVLLPGVGEDALGLALLLGVLLRLPQAPDVLARMPLRPGHGGRPVLALVEDAPDLGLAVGRLVRQPRDHRGGRPVARRPLEAEHALGRRWVERASRPRSASGRRRVDAHTGPGKPHRLDPTRAGTDVSRQV